MTTRSRRRRGRPTTTAVARFALVVTLCLAAGPARPDGAAAAARGDARPPRLVLVSWDGAADWVVDRLLAAGSLPNLARLAARGVAADYSVSTFPTKTAAAHAALWTGCWGTCNGVTSNEIPVLPAAEHTLLEQRSGYSSRALTAEPIFVAAARAGRSVVVLSATQSYPPEPIVDALRRGLPPGGDDPAARYRSFSGFELTVAPGRVLGAGDWSAAESLRRVRRRWRRIPGGFGRRGRVAAPREVAFQVGDSAFYALAFDDPADPVRGLDTVLVREGGRDPRQAIAEAVLKPREAGVAGAADAEPGSDATSEADEAAAAGAAATPRTAWSPPFAVAKGDRRANTFFRLFDLAPDGSRLTLYQRKASDLGGVHTAADLAAYLAAYPGFHDVPFDLYDDGALGVPLPLGGDGTAERRVVEMVAFDTDLLIGGTRFALTTWRPDVLLHYSPMTDSAGHAWVGAPRPDGPRPRPGAGGSPLAVLHPGLSAARPLARRHRRRRAARHHRRPGQRSRHGRDAPGLLPQPARWRRRASSPVPPAARSTWRAPAFSVPAFGRFRVVVNDVSWRGGIVPVAERRGDPRSGGASPPRRPRSRRRRPPGRAASSAPRISPPCAAAARRRPADDPDGTGATAGGDLYFDTAPGYYPRGRPRRPGGRRPPAIHGATASTASGRSGPPCTRSSTPPGPGCAPGSPCPRSATSTSRPPSPG